MNTRVMAIRWPGGGNPIVTLMGRKLFGYENVDNWILDPDTFEIFRPRSFGRREGAVVASPAKSGVQDDGG